MHAIKGAWAGQTFAVAASNDSGGRKSRIRRSKGERKEMVESFIHKYQKTNDGNFPSLNLTHKEVGGSFYTVREIVREIIQENRVLAPPKFSFEEHGHSEFLEQHPLGSISMEPQIDLATSDKVHVLTHSEYQIASEEHISSSTLQFHGSDLVQSDKEQIVNGFSKVAENDEISDGTSLGHPATPNHYQDTRTEEVLKTHNQLPKLEHHEDESKNIVSDGEVLEVNGYSEEPPTINTVLTHQGNNGSTLLSRQNIHAGGTPTDEKYVNENDHIGDKTKEVWEQTSKELVEASEPVLPNGNSTVVVETFPVRPVSSTIHDLDGESGKFHETNGTLKEKGIDHDRTTLNQITSDLVNETDIKKVMASIDELNAGYRDENVVLSLQEPAPESSLLSSTFKNTLIGADDVKDLEMKDSPSGETNVGNSKGQLIHEDSAPVGTKVKASNPTLDRINLETWDGASKNSIRPESNPLLAFVKSFVTAFVKFWTE